MTDRRRKALIDWIHTGHSVTAAFLGSLVECVEAVTIVLAVGTVRGWRSALLGRFHRPGADLSILGLAGGFLIVSLLTVVALRRETLQRGAA
jgi:Ca2+/H+ antiporter, TMEM165/GDT1 family